MWPDIDAEEFSAHVGIRRRGDGMVHCSDKDDVPIKKKHTMAYNTGKYDTECCEHCPRKECGHGSLKPCLSEITYREWMEVKADLWRRVSDGDDLCGILRDLDLPYRTLDVLLRGGNFTGKRFGTGYPPLSVQKKLKKYIEKRRKNNGIC